MAVTSLADHRRHRRHKNLENALAKFLAMGGTKAKARQIIDAIISAESAEARATVIKHLRSGGGDHDPESIQVNE